jgi:hypothetical protein
MLRARATICACGCGREFVAKRSTRRYLSAACRSKSYRRRKDPLVGSFERKLAQREGLDWKYDRLVRRQVRGDLAARELVPADADDPPRGSWDRVRQGHRRLGDGIKRYRESAPPKLHDRVLTYRPFSGSEDRRINGDPIHVHVRPTDKMRELARQRAPVPDTFPCSICGGTIKIKNVLKHTCERKAEIVTIAEYRALDAKIDQLSEAMARVEETVCMVAARFASDESVQAAVDEFLAGFYAEDKTAAA